MVLEGLGPEDTPQPYRGSVDEPADTEGAMISPCEPVVNFVSWSLISAMRSRCSSRPIFFSYGSQDPA